MKTAIRNLTTSLASAGAFATTMISTAWAQTTSGGFGGTPNIDGLPEGSGADGVRNVIIDVLEAVLSFLALIAVVIIVIAGIRLIVSQGEDEQKDKAKKTIFYAIIGLVIVLFARVIVSLVTEYLASEVRA
jgi:succinate dehydrogenase/fumarate reductase cytochrome b subunit